MTTETNPLKAVHDNAFAEGVRYALNYLVIELGLDVADCDLADEYSISCGACGELVLDLEGHTEQLCDENPKNWSDSSQDPANHFVNLTPFQTYLKALNAGEINAETFALLTTDLNR